MSRFSYTSKNVIILTSHNLVDLRAIFGECYLTYACKFTLRASFSYEKSTSMNRMLPVFLDATKSNA